MPRGVRLNPEHDDRTRAKIQTSQIINRLNSFINGEVNLSAAQVTAALGLLRKTIPDLSAVDHSGDLTLRHEDVLNELGRKLRDFDSSETEQRSPGLRGDLSQHTH